MQSIIKMFLLITVALFMVVPTSYADEDGLLLYQCCYGSPLFLGILDSDYNCSDYSYCMNDWIIRRSDPTENLYMLISGNVNGPPCSYTAEMHAHLPDTFEFSLPTETIMCNSGDTVKANIFIPAESRNKTVYGHCPECDGDHIKIRTSHTYSEKKGITYCAITLKLKCLDCSFSHTIQSDVCPQP